MTLAIKNQKRNEILQKMTDAMHNQDETAYREAIEELAQDIESSLLNQYEETLASHDSQILASRGVRQLTSKETKYFEKVIEAMRSNDPKQSLSNLDVVMPETVLDSVFEDLRTSHPLLSKINFENTAGMIKFLVNTNGFQKAVWGKLTAEITEELASGFKEINMGLMKLSAFIPVPKAMLDLGPAWLDRYVREVLYEALANGLEDGIINNLDTSSGPIGMVADLDEGTASGDKIVYTIKTATEITDLSPVTVGAQLAKLAKDDNGKERLIKDVLFIVNPTDYFTKVFPATTIMGADGTYRKDVMPYPMDVIQSPAVKSGKAVLGLGYRYFAGVGMGSKDGKIEYDDSYKFLEDERTYLIKLYANGKALDNNAFILLDISDLKPLTIKVETVTEVTNMPEPTTN